MYYHQLHQQLALLLRFGGAKMSSLRSADNNYSGKGSLSALLREALLVVSPR